MPQGLAEPCARHASIRILPSPVKAPPIEAHPFWHRRFHKDPAHVGLRTSVHGLFGW